MFTMNPGLWAFIAACLVAEASGDYSAGTTLQKNECQINLETCILKYDMRVLTEEELSAYYDCVMKVACIRNHRGYLDRLKLLSTIRDRLVAKNPESGNWWRNSACKLDRALLTSVISIVSSSMIFYAKVN